MTFPPHRIPALIPKIFPQLLWRMPANETTIYLTFDDGPVAGPTDFVLETLNSFQAKATFFCIGDNIRKFPEVFRKVAEAGHTIGNHTFNHLKGWSTSLEEYVENVRLCDQQLSIVNCQLTNLFRPPFGQITPKQIKALSEYRVVMWDVLSLDYLDGGSKEKYLQGTLRAARPGSIVVFHDSFNAEKKLQYILPPFLDHFSSLGYRFKSLSPAIPG